MRPRTGDTTVNARVLTAHFADGEKTCGTPQPVGKSQQPVDKIWKFLGGYNDKDAKELPTMS